MANTQNSPNFVRGQIPTAAQWNSYYASKLDALVGVTLTTTIDTTVAATVSKIVIDTSAGVVRVTYSPSLGSPGKENRVRFVKKSVTPNTNQAIISDGVNDVAYLINENDSSGAGWLDIDANGTILTNFCGVP